MNANYKPGDEHFEANFKIPREAPMLQHQYFFFLLTNQPAIVVRHKMINDSIEKLFKVV